MIELIKEVQLLAFREGNYTVYVFKCITTDEYIMCTRLPNWQVPNINIKDIGFLQYQIVKAGDKYITPNGETIYYKYSNVYFINFINKADNINNKEIIL